MNEILICQGFTKILELFHSFRGFITCLHFVYLSCILFTRHKHILSFLSIYFSNLWAAFDPQGCVMRPAATFVDYVYNIKIAK